MKLSTVANVASLAVPGLGEANMARLAGQFALKEAGKFGAQHLASSSLEDIFGSHGSGGQGEHPDVLQEAMQATMPTSSE